MNMRICPSRVTGAGLAEGPALTQSVPGTQVLSSQDPYLLTIYYMSFRFS